MNDYRDYYNYINNNYNKPNYNQDKEKINIYDPYDGLIRGNMFPELYNTYKKEKPINIIPNNEQAEMLTTIDALEFALIDLNLLLDIYPENKELLKEFNKYRVDNNIYKKEYQSKYGPLCINDDVMENYPFLWINSPWPWEGDK